MKPMSLLVYNFVVHNDPHLCSVTCRLQTISTSNVINLWWIFSSWLAINRSKAINLPSCNLAMFKYSSVPIFGGLGVDWCGLFAWTRNLSEANKTHFLTLRRPSCTGAVGRFCQMFWWNWKQTQFTFLSWKRSSPWVLWSVQRQTSSDPVNGNNNAT